MPSTEKLPHLLFRLWEHFSPRRKGQFALLLILMVLVSFAEVLSLGAIVPFLAALTNPKQIFELPIAQPFIQLAGIQDARRAAADIDCAEISFKGIYLF